MTVPQKKSLAIHKMLWSRASLLPQVTCIEKYLRNQILFKIPEVQRANQAVSERERKLSIFCFHVLQTLEKERIIQRFDLTFFFVTQNSVLSSSILTNEKYTYTESIAQDPVKKGPELTAHFHILGFLYILRAERAQGR